MIVTATPSPLALWSFEFEGSVNNRVHVFNVKRETGFSSIIRLRNKDNNSGRRVVITCGLRASYKKRPPSKVLSKEAIQVIHALKLAKSSPDKVEHVLNDRLMRLLKGDVLDVLAELQRQNHLDLSFKVFEFIREEPGYDTMLALYSDMILLLGRNKMIEMAEEIFAGVMEKGLEPDTRMYTEMIGAYIQVGVMEKAMEIYGTMKESGCKPDRLTFMILIRSLEKIGKVEMAEALKHECFDYVDFPDKFIQEVEQKHGKRRPLNLA